MVVAACSCPKPVASSMVSGQWGTITSIKFIIIAVVAVAGKEILGFDFNNLSFEFEDLLQVRVIGRVIVRVVTGFGLRFRLGFVRVPIISALRVSEFF